MAHIDTRNIKPDKDGKPRKSYLVRWIHASGKEQAQAFRRFADARDFKTEIEGRATAGHLRRSVCW